LGEVRLQKFIASAGISSRREAERLILSGRVSVNRRVTKTLGVKVDPEEDVVALDGVPIRPVEEKSYLMLNKPREVITTCSDPENRKTVMNLLSKAGFGEGRNRVFSIGRLDYQSEGLLLFTNDGMFAKELSHPSRHIPRVYWVRVRGNPSERTIQELVDGVMLEDGLAKAVDVNRIKSNPKSTWLEITLVEGRNREVRRMFDSIGHPVLRLRRVGFGGIRLGDLPVGFVRELEPEEIESLRGWME
jgi:23S rRNA pseudouridine2605 synthase